MEVIIMIKSIISLLVVGAFVVGCIHAIGNAWDTETNMRLERQASYVQELEQHEREQFYAEQVELHKHCK